MKFFVLLLCFFTLAACSSRPSPSQVIAQCEQKAYGEIGVQPDEQASLMYALTKQELVRVCAVSAGLRLRSREWAPYPLKIRESVYRQYGIWTESPNSEKYQRYIDAAMEEWDRQVAIANISPEFWE